MKSNDRRKELEKELSHIKWDILGLRETRRPIQQMSISLNSGRIIYLTNEASDTHLREELF